MSWHNQGTTALDLADLPDPEVKLVIEEIIGLVMDRWLELERAWSISLVRLDFRSNDEGGWGFRMQNSWDLP